MAPVTVPYAHVDSILAGQPKSGTLGLLRCCLLVCSRICKRVAPANWSGDGQGCDRIRRWDKRSCCSKGPGRAVPALRAHPPNAVFSALTNPLLSDQPAHTTSTSTPSIRDLEPLLLSASAPDSDSRTRTRQSALAGDGALLRDTVQHRRRHTNCPCGAAHFLGHGWPGEVHES